ncbi:UbiA family prenyltransferase [Patescibacteria group bacterium]|nr:UbiA family prenyltransferase [Patescibacteria group bacterium]MBU4069299.1 UbiA family prenyltransferase [Pseudomonadota bacterium]
MSVKKYVSMTRPDHWVKNVFMLPGTAVALIEVDLPLAEVIYPLVIGFVSLCLVASSNYVINEVLDAKFDKYHPIKKYRPAVNQRISLKVAYLEYAGLLVAGILLGYVGVNFLFALALVLLAVCGFFYNVKPFRMKDRVYIDVIFESFNNVIRLLLGWFVVSMTFIPPFSLIISFWAAGAFLMATKRYAEYREIGDPVRAGLYRRSFKYYNERTLLMSSFFYAINFAFFFGLFLYKYRIEYILLYPVFAWLFTWYLFIAMQPNSAAQNPHKLLKEKILMLLLACTVVGLFILTFLDIPVMQVLLKNYYITMGGSGK